MSPPVHIARDAQANIYIADSHAGDPGSDVTRVLGADRTLVSIADRHTDGFAGQRSNRGAPEKTSVGHGSLRLPALSDLGFTPRRAARCVFRMPCRR
jgi:hypothetical protein